MSDTVILHMSDLHFTSDLDLKKEKENIMDSLIEEIQCIEPLWKPQIVCVSGDIVDRYDVEAYPIAKEWFEKLAEKLEIPMDHFVFTPGNHDCSRDVMQYPVLDTSNEETVRQMLGCSIPQYLTGRFSAYENFCKELQVTPYTWASGDNYLVGYRVIDNIIFWGCNTEWFAYEDNSKLRLGKKIIEELQHSTAEWSTLKKIAVMHHGVENGFHENEIQYHNSICPSLHHLWTVCNMTLYGHSHEQIGGSPNKMENHCYTVRAGATSMNQNYPNNVNLVQIKENSFELRYIDYSPQNVEHHWNVSDKAQEYIWNEQINDVKRKSNTLGNIGELQQKIATYAQDILDNKLRQVKLLGELPRTISRKVVVQQYKDDKEKTEGSESIELENVVFAENRVIVQGELGAGKSTMLAQMVLAIHNISNTYLPLFIPAKELAQTNDGKVNSLLETIRLFIQEELLFKVESFNDLLECVEHCYLFVDGLDEVEKKKQESLMRVLEKIPTMEGRMSVVLSTRATETVEYHRDNWKQCNLGKLQYNEIFQILINEALADGKGEQSCTYAKQCLVKINQNPMVQMVANTPLAVRLLYHVFEKNNNLDAYTIGDLLNLLLEERLERWDEKNVSEVIEEEFEKSFPTLDVKKRYIGYLAYNTEQNKMTKRKLELMLSKNLGAHVNASLLTEQTLAKLKRSGIAVVQNEKLEFVYRPLLQNAMGFYFANEIIQHNISAQEISVELWREISFAASELRRADLFNGYREWFVSYVERLKVEPAGLTKACYICYESKDTELAKKMIENFRERDVRPLWYYEEERNASLNIVAQTIALAGEEGINWFIESYLTLTYPVINMGSRFFTELYIVLAILIKDKLSVKQKEMLQKCIEPLDYICPIAYIGLPEILCYLMPEMYTVETRVKLMAKLAYRDSYRSWVLGEYKKLCVDYPILCSNALRENNSFAASCIWMEIFENEPDVKMVGKIIESEDEEMIAECRKRLGQEKYIRYLRLLLASSEHRIAAASALQLCNEHQDHLLEVKKSLVGGMINARKHNLYEEKITDLINKEGGLSDKWVEILFNREHFVYGASEGCWRIFLTFLLETDEDMSEIFIKCLPFTGPFLLARCEETRLLLCRLLVRQEYKEALVRAMNMLNPEISHVASRIGLIACPELEAVCLCTVISESTYGGTDNQEWQRFVMERKYEEPTLQQLRAEYSTMNNSMRKMAKRILDFNDDAKKQEDYEITKEEWIARELESISRYGIQNLRGYINFLNNEVHNSIYLQMQEKYKNNTRAEELLCFYYAEGQYKIDWPRLIWYIYIGHDVGFRDVDVFSLEVIAYGKEHPDETESILNAVKEVCADERFEKTRWVSQYHWLLLIIATFEGLNDSVIKEAFVNRNEHYGEASLALVAMYSGKREELSIAKKQEREQEETENIDYSEMLLDYAKETEKIPRKLEYAIQSFIQEINEVDVKYINQLIDKGENGTLIAGVISYCYGKPIPVQSGMISHQNYVVHMKIDSQVFIKLLHIVRNAFKTQMEDADELEKYKKYLEEQETRLEELPLGKDFIIYEYLHCFGDLMDAKKIIKFIEVVMDGMFFGGYTNSIWKLMVPHIVSQNKDEKEQIAKTLELAIHKIIGTCEEKLSYRFEDAYELLVISCMYWYLSDRHVLLAQPVFERGMIQLFYYQNNRSQWEPEMSHRIIEKLEEVFRLLPKDILNNALKQMQYSWLPEGRILGRMFQTLISK